MDSEKSYMANYMALIHLIDNVTLALENHEFTCIFIDLSKAFAS